MIRSLFLLKLLRVSLIGCPCCLVFKDQMWVTEPVYPIYCRVSHLTTLNYNSIFSVFCQLQYLACQCSMFVTSQQRYIIYHTYLKVVNLISYFRFIFYRHKINA